MSSGVAGITDTRDGQSESCSVSALATAEVKRQQSRIKASNIGEQDVRKISLPITGNVEQVVRGIEYRGDATEIQLQYATGKEITADEELVICRRPENFHEQDTVAFKREIAGNGQYTRRVARADQAMIDDIAFNRAAVARKAAGGPDGYTTIRRNNTAIVDNKTAISTSTTPRSTNVKTARILVVSQFEISAFIADYGL